MKQRLKQTIIGSLGVIAVALAAAAPASAERDFGQRFSTVATGDIAFAANTLMTCDLATEGADCTKARDDTSITLQPRGSSSWMNNNQHAMVAVDVDTDPTTTNSSTARLAIPAGASVLFAGLYWTASAPSGMTAARAKQAKLRGPLDTAYSDVTATGYDPADATYYGYSSFLDVTDMVRKEGAGSWTFGGAAMRPGLGSGAGWSLVVVWSAPGMPLRDLTVTDGQRVVSGTNLISIPISGFRAPAAGRVQSDVGMVAFEGDRGVAGDYLQLNSTIVKDALHPTDNTFNSWISNSGVPAAGRNPSYGNQLGFDAAIFSTDGVIPNNATSAELRAKTNGEGYMPIVLTFSTELYAPKLTVTKTVSDVNGGQVRVGDQLEYEITVQNDGGDGAVNTVLQEDFMPPGTEFVAGSLSYDPGTGYGALTDTTSDDAGDAAGGAGPLAVRMGVGRSAARGGLIPAASGAAVVQRVKFRVKVVDLPPSGSVISNSARVNFAAQTLGSEIESHSNQADIRVLTPDLSIKKTISSSNFANGLPAAYTLLVSNVGDSATEGETVVTDTLPAGLSSPSVTSSPGWTCSIIASVLTCSRSDALAAARSYPTIVVSSNRLENVSGAVVTNTANVTTPLDSNSTNDSSIAEQTVGAGHSALPVQVVADVGDVLPGDQATFTADFFNSGPSRAVNPELRVVLEGLTGEDVLATGFTVESSDGTVTAADCKLTQSLTTRPTVTCRPGTLADGVTVQIKLTLQPRIAIDATKLDVAATSSADNDPVSLRMAVTSVDIVPTSDLEISKTASSATVDIGQTVDFTIRATNNGPQTAKRVRIFDVVPAELSVVSATWSLDGGAVGQPCSIIGQDVECGPLGDIAKQGSAGAQFAEVKITARNDQGGHGLRVNRAGVDTQSIDLFPDNDVAAAEVTLLPSADLTIGKLGPASLAPGAKGQFTLVVRNYGPSDALGTQLTDSFPAGLEPDPADVAAHGCNVTQPPVTPTPVMTCKLADDALAGIPTGTLTSGGVWTVAVKAKAAAGLKPGSVLVNRASASSSTPDPNPASASDMVRVLVATAASKRIGVSITAPKSSTPVGQILKLLVKVSAPKGSSVTGVSACAALPSNVRYVSSTGSRSGSRICWQVGSLAAAASRSFTLKVKAVVAGVADASVAARGSGAARVTDTDVVRTHSFTG